MDNRRAPADLNAKNGQAAATEVELPSTVRVGDTFMFGSDDDQEEVEIVGIEHGTDSDGLAVSTLNVAPFPDFTYQENGHERSRHRAQYRGR